MGAVEGSIVPSIFMWMKLFALALGKPDKNIVKVIAIDMATTNLLNLIFLLLLAERLKIGSYYSCPKSCIHKRDLIGLPKVLGYFHYVINVYVIVTIDIEDNVPCARHAYSPSNLDLTCYLS